MEELEQYKVTYRSSEKIIGIMSDEMPTCGEIFGIQIKEFYESDSYSEIEEGLGKYYLELSYTVKNDSELMDLRNLVFNAVDLIDRLWVYVEGRPFSKKTHGTVMVPIHPDDSPKGWVSNAQDVKKKLNKQDLYADFSIENISWSYSDEYPLRKLLGAIPEYESLDEEVRLLMELHYESFIVSRTEAKLFLLAKALEVAKAILPGENPKETQRYLFEELASSMTQPFDWLFNIANNRREIRHVIKCPKDTSLHPELTQEEKDSFSENAQLVIRSIICKYLKLPFFIIRKK